MSRPTLTTRERFQRIFEHREADRIPIVDLPWRSTLARWQREGLPEGMDYRDYFDLDHASAIWVDNSPRLPVCVLERTDEYEIRTTSWGTTEKHWLTRGGVPEYLDFTVKDRASWQPIRERMKPADDRVDWERLRREYPRWRERGDFIVAHFWFGFDVTHARVIGTERCLMAMIEDPEWIMEMIDAELELDLQMFQRVWDAGYHFDAIHWPDDLGYKHSQFFSLNLYREVLKPFHQKAIDFAKAKGVKVMLHSCGDVNPFVPEWIAMGVDCLNPLEVKAGMDPLKLKETYGNDLVLHGGINAVLWDDPDAIMQEIERVVPVLKRHGGYIFSSDHSIPDSISLKQFEAIINRVKEVGRYD